MIYELNKLDDDKLKFVPVDLKKVSNIVDKEVVKKNAIDTSKCVNKTGYNDKVWDINDRGPSITNLATTAAFTTVENKIPNVNNFIKNKLWWKNFRHWG